MIVINDKRIKMINDHILMDKVVTMGLKDADGCELFTNAHSDLISINKDIICYVYFKDIVDIRYIVVNSMKDKNVKLTIWNYNMNIDFDSEGIDVKTITSNKKEYINNKLFDLTTDYFTLKLTNLKHVTNIVFYGKYNRLNTRKLESIRINHPSQCNDSIFNTIMTNVTNACV